LSVSRLSVDLNLWSASDLKCSRSSSYFSTRTPFIAKRIAARP